MDSGSCPGGILLGHLLEELTELGANLWFCPSPSAGKKTPFNGLAQQPAFQNLTDDQLKAVTAFLQNQGRR